jgi:hypothetical protein
MAFPVSILRPAIGSVAKGPKFRLQNKNTKSAEKIFRGRENLSCQGGELKSDEL